MKNDAKFKLKELTYRFKIDMRNLVNFDTSTQIHKMSTLIGSFCVKYITFDLKKSREVIFNDTE